MEVWLVKYDVITFALCPGWPCQKLEPPSLGDVCVGPFGLQVCAVDWWSWRRCTALSAWSPWTSRTWPPPCAPATTKCACTATSAYAKTTGRRLAAPTAGLYTTRSVYASSSSTPNSAPRPRQGACPQNPSLQSLTSPTCLSDLAVLAILQKMHLLLYEGGWRYCTRSGLGTTCCGELKGIAET